MHRTSADIRYRNFCDDRRTPLNLHIVLIVLGDNRDAQRQIRRRVGPVSEVAPGEVDVIGLLRAPEAQLEGGPRYIAGNDGVGVGYRVHASRVEVGGGHCDRACLPLQIGIPVKVNDNIPAVVARVILRDLAIGSFYLGRAHLALLEGQSGEGRDHGSILTAVGVA